MKGEIINKLRSLISDTANLMTIATCLAAMPLLTEIWKSAILLPVRPYVAEGEEPCI